MVTAEVLARQQLSPCCGSPVRSCAGTTGEPGERPAARRVIGFTMAARSGTTSAAEPWPIAARGGFCRELGAKCPYGLRLAPQPPEALAQRQERESILFHNTRRGDRVFAQGRVTMPADSQLARRKNRL